MNARDRRTDFHAQSSATEIAGHAGMSLRTRGMLRRWAQRKAAGEARAQPQIPEGGGRPLDGAHRERMESQLGADLSGVRVHDGEDSARAADDLGARAFTVGKDIHFGQNELAPGTVEGDRLLAHELAHTAQAQNAGIEAKLDNDEGDGELDVSQPEDASEVEADRIADHAVEGLHEGAAPRPEIAGAAPAGAARKIHRAPKATAASQDKGDDPLDPFRKAVEADGGLLYSKWEALPPAHQVKVELRDIQKAMSLDVRVGIRMMIATQVDFSTSGLAEAFFADRNWSGPDGELASFFEAEDVRTAGLVRSFCEASPRGSQLTDKQRRALRDLLAQTEELFEARAIYEKVFGPLGKAPDGQRWTVDTIKQQAWQAGQEQQSAKADGSGLPGAMSHDKLPMPVLKSLMRVEHAKDKPRGMTLLGPDESTGLQEGLKRLPPEHGKFDVACHGTEEVFGVQGDDHLYHPVSGAEMAELVNAAGGEHQPIRLISCFTGGARAGAASQLASALGAPVSAPTGAASIDEHGGLDVGDVEAHDRPEFLPLGWRDFGPDGKPIGFRQSQPITHLADVKLITPRDSQDVIVKTDRAAYRMDPGGNTSVQVHGSVPAEWRPIAAAQCPARFDGGNVILTLDGRQLKYVKDGSRWTLDAELDAKLGKWIKWDGQRWVRPES